MIKGKRIKLQLFKDEAEVASYYESYNQINERAITDHTEIVSLDARIQDFRKSGLWTKERGLMALVDMSDTIIGAFSFHKSDDFELEIGYRIVTASARGSGYGSEALPLFSSYLFNCHPEITRLKIRTAEDNLASRHLAEKSGFQQEGILRQAYFYRGHMTNMVIYSLLRSESPLLEVLIE